MKTVRVVLAVLLIVSVSTLVRADREDRADNFRATLIGFDEVPSVSTPARGRFAASFNRDTQTLSATRRPPRVREEQTARHRKLVAGWCSEGACANAARRRARCENPAHGAAVSVRRTA